MGTVREVSEMSRYIDAEALKEKFINTDANGINLTIDRYALKCIEDAPSIDIVRCKECNAYTTDGYADGCGFCAYHHSVVQADDFCSYGEREGE